MGRIMRLVVAGVLTAASSLGGGSAAAQSQSPFADRPAEARDSTAGPDAKPLPQETNDRGLADDSDSRITTPPSPATLLDPNVRPIDLNTALRLAGVQNPQLMIARQRVVEAAALRQLAAAQILPSINLGMNYDSHSGPLQQSNGNILPVNRSALYLGAGSGAVAAGTVAVPGVLLEGNVAAGVFGYLASRQVVAQRQFATLAIRNQTFLQTTLAYSELLRAEGRRAVSLQVRDEAKRVAELTASYANEGQGRPADAQRAQTELESREYDIQAAEEAILTSSARLCYVLNLDPSIRLHPTDAFVVPHPVVPDPTSVRELIALGLLQRPELKERQAAIREAFLALEGAKLLPFSPTILIGYSGGGFGGGSNLVRPVFGAFGGRSDLDLMAYWTLQNLGVGNLAQINLGKARLGVTNFQEIAVLDQVRAEVAEAYAKTHARYARIGTSERAVRSGTRGFQEDLIRIENSVAPAIETVDSLRLLARARYAYLDAIVDYDRAQFELYVALGQPPADALAHPVPTTGVTPSPEPTTASPDRPANINPAESVPLRDSGAPVLAPIAPSSPPARSS
ncbi:MAG: TolC family protein [Paludisphaera borealis]|uniref:TolC family protein n=1 Tax=Paludisphaera borealis TaxID=1387353 RepID=UPI0028470306|nr:TolC family protein [Paludisphaera borealis]MDR3618191.1 TolC family protein [Paludisphaera borealis]